MNGARSPGHAMTFPSTSFTFKVIDKDPTWRAGAVFTRGELEQLISDDRLPPDRRVLWALLGLAGLRFGEAAALRFRHYDATLEPLGRLLIASSWHTRRREETAASYAGINKTTFYAWLRRGARESRGLYHAFSEAVEKAHADSETRDVGLIAKAAADGVWQAAAWRLERKFPDRWGRRDRIDATVKGAITHGHVDLGKIDLSRVTKEELDALETIYTKLLPAPEGAAGSGIAPGAGGEGTPESA